VVRISVYVLICTSGRLQNKRLSKLQGFSSKAKTTLPTRSVYSRTCSASAGCLSGPETRRTRGSSMWARERIKAHTKRCREHITRQSLQRVRQGHDFTADDSSNIKLISDKLSVANKLPIVELTVDTTLVGSSSTPKSSPASFSDVSAILCFSKLFF